MNNIIKNHISELNRLNHTYIIIANESNILYKTNSLILNKFCSFINSVAITIKNDVAKLLDGISIKFDSNNIYKKLELKLDEYDYLSMRLNTFRIPQGMGVKYIEYIDWLYTTLLECQNYFDKYSTTLLSLIADLSVRPEKYVGKTIIPKFDPFDKDKFDNNIRHIFTKNGQSTTRWMNIVKRNGDYLTVVKKLNNLCEQPIFKKYNNYLSEIKDLIDRTNIYVNNISSGDLTTALSPNSIAVLSSNLLTMAKAIEVFGLSIYYLNDFIIVIDSNNSQILKMK